MFALESPIIERLKAVPALTGWHVRGSAREASRLPTPAVEVHCGGADSVLDACPASVGIVVVWSVYLIVQYGEHAMGDLDAAFAAVIKTLHNWRPGEVQGRKWKPLRIEGVRPPEFAEQGQIAYALMFKSSARFEGVRDA